MVWCNLRLFRSGSLCVCFQRMPECVENALAGWTAVRMWVCNPFARHKHQRVPTRFSLMRFQRVHARIKTDTPAMRGRTRPHTRARKAHTRTCTDAHMHAHAHTRTIAGRPPPDGAGGHAGGDCADGGSGAPEGGTLAKA